MAAAMSEHSGPPIAPPLVVASVQKTMTREPSIRPRAMTIPCPARWWDYNRHHMPRSFGVYPARPARSSQ
jgi:hypothetical protein